MNDKTANTNTYNIQRNLINGGQYCFFTHNGKEYYADKAYTFDHGEETMIFASENNQVTNWTELYCDRSGKSLESCIEEFKKNN